MVSIYIFHFTQTTSLNKTAQNAKTGFVGNLTKSEIRDYFIKDVISEKDWALHLDKHQTQNKIDHAPLIMGMFIIILFGARINGSHYNPLITFSFMLGNVRSNKFDRVLGLFYIMAQYAGAMAGGIMQLTINGITEYNAPFFAKEDDYWPSLLTEIVGSFILVFMYLLSTKESTKFSKDQVT